MKSTIDPMLLNQTPSSMNVDFKDFFGTASEILEPLFNRSEFPWQMLEGLEEFIMDLPLGQIHGLIDPRADVRERSLVYLGFGSEIGPGAFVEGPVYIGNNVKIRHGAYIRGPAFIDDGSIIGHASEVKHSIMFKKSSAAHFNYVGNSILGENVALGAGATCANLRFDKKPIVVRSKNNRFATRHIKMGAFVGKNAKIGCQAVLSPGACIEVNSLVPPLTSVQGYFEKVK